MPSNPPFSLGRVLGRTFSIWGRNTVQLAILNAIIHSPVILHAALAMPREGDDPRSFMAVQTIGQILLGFMATAAVIHGVFQQLRGQPVGIGACLRVCLGRFFPVLGVALLTGLVIGIAVLPIAFMAGIAGSRTWLAVGTIAAAIVGLALYCMFWVAIPVTVVEKPGVGASLSRSLALTKGARLSVFLIVLIVVILIPYVANVVTAMVTADVASMVWARLVVAVVLGALTAVATAVGYHDLRVAKEGVGIEQLVSVFA